MTEARGERRELGSWTQRRRRRWCRPAGREGADHGGGGRSEVHGENGKTENWREIFGLTGLGVGRIMPNRQPGMLETGFRASC